MSKQAVVCSGFSSRRPGLEPGTVSGRVVVEKVANGQVFLRVLRSFPVSIILLARHPIFIYMLLLAEGQTGEAWGPSIKERSFTSIKTLDRKILSLGY